MKWTILVIQSFILTLNRSDVNYTSILKKGILRFLLQKEFIYLQLNTGLFVSYFVKGESFMFKKYITLVIFVSLLFAPSMLSAQCDPCPPGQRPNPACRCVPTGPGVPIDGGLMILLAAGVAFGIKKIRD